MPRSALGLDLAAIQTGLDVDDRTTWATAGRARPLEKRMREGTQFWTKAVPGILGITLSCAGHLSIEAMSAVDQVTVVSIGWIDQVGTPCEICENPGTDSRCAFIGQPGVFDGIVREIRSASTAVHTRSSISWQPGDGGRNRDWVDMLIPPPQAEHDGRGTRGTESKAPSMNMFTEAARFTTACGN